MKKALTKRGKLSLGAILAIIGAALGIYNGIPWATKDEFKELKSDLVYDINYLRDRLDRLQEGGLK